MEKNLYLNIDDDVTRAANKISRERAADVTLILPKESWLFANLANLKLLKKHTDALGKNISILTNDQAGQKLAEEVGFSLKSMDVLRRSGNSMDVISRKQRQPAWQEMYPKKAEPAVMVPAAAPYVPPVPEPVYAPQPVSEEPGDYSYTPQVMPEISLQAPVAEPVAAAVVAEPVIEQAFERPVQTVVEAKPVPKLIPKRQNLEPEEYIPKKPSYKKGLIFLFVSIVLAALVIGTMILPQADLIVYAHGQPITRDMQIVLDQNVKEPNTKDLVLPAKISESNQSITKQFTSTGLQNVGIVAKGTMQIYNFTGKTLKLGAKTTKISVGKKTYHLEKDISGIKPTKKFKNGTDVDPASLTPEVAIIADQAGDDYNFPGGTRLEIDNDILGANPDVLYAQSTKPIEGGVSRYTNIISQGDLDTATKLLNQAALDSAKQAAMTKDGSTLLDAGTSMQVKNIFFDKKVGDTAINFNGTITATVKGLAFKTADVTKMVRERVVLTLDKGKYLADDQDVNFKIEFKSADLNLGTGIINVNYNGKVISNVDSTDIESKVRGKSPSEVKEILLSNPDIDGVDLTLKPFWVTSVPHLFGKVFVHTQAK